MVMEAIDEGLALPPPGGSQWDELGEVGGGEAPSPGGRPAFTAQGEAWPAKETEKEAQTPELSG